MTGRAGGFTSSYGTNYQNYTGQPYFSISDPNCKCFDPQHTQVLNPGAWSDAPAGTWGTAAPFLGYRWQRQPAESASLARNFRIGKEGRYNLQIRGEFQNIFNRLFLAAPSLANPLLPVTTTNYNGAAINNAGFGSIGTLNGGGAQPRSGQLVARFSF